MAARAQEIVIEIEGMHSQTDVAVVCAVLRDLAGVSDATGSFAESSATVTADPTIATADLLSAAVVAAGFTPGDVRFPE